MFPVKKRKRKTPRSTTTMSSHKRAPMISTRPWWDLPKHITSNIISRLTSSIDMFQFLSVCRNWRATGKPNPESLLSLSGPLLPCRIPNNNLPFTAGRKCHLILVRRAVFLVRPCSSSPEDSTGSGWLLTVEEMVPGKLRILYPLSFNLVKHLPSNFPRYLDLQKFRVCEVARSYGLRYVYDGSIVDGVQKVVLCCGSSAPTMMVLSVKGTLVGVRLQTGNWGYVRDSLVRSFRDVIDFKGMVCAVDCHLDVLRIDYKTMNVVHTSYGKLTDRSFCTSRLVESNAGLHVVECSMDYIGFSYDITQFKVYKWDEIKSKWDTGYCLRSSIIFVSLGWCFLADIPGINGEYIVYFRSGHVGSISKERQLFQDASTDLRVGVFCRFHYRHRSCWNHIADWLWPPPIWFLPEKYTLSGDDEEDKNDEDLNIRNLDLSFPAKAPTGANNEGMDLPTTAVKTSNAPRIQSKQNHSRMMFEGLSIKSNLVPPLQKVWAKYGNILEGSIIRNADIITQVLESLAASLIILETSSGRSLDKTQADYLSSVLCDLQQMNFRVEWLVPSVKKALAVHKSKPLVNSLKDFSRAKAEAEKMKLKVLDELAKLDEVEEDMALVSERLPALESVDLDQSLGDGLY